MCVLPLLFSVYMLFFYHLFPPHAISIDFFFLHLVRASLTLFHIDRFLECLHWLYEEPRTQNNLNTNGFVSFFKFISPLRMPPLHYVQPSQAFLWIRRSYWNLPSIFSFFILSPFFSHSKWIHVKYFLFLYQKTLTVTINFRLQPGLWSVVALLPIFCMYGGLAKTLHAF